MKLLPTVLAVLLVVCSAVAAEAGAVTSQNPDAQAATPPRAKTTAEELLSLTPESASQLEHANEAGLIEIAPVSLPPPDAGPCDHFGWPIGTMTGDTIVVMYRRLPGHKPAGADMPDENLSGGIVLRSEDGGKTWSKPYDLRDCMKPADRQRDGLVPLMYHHKWDKENTTGQGYKVRMPAIGTTRDGAVVAVNPHGVFRSDDRGRTWKHFPIALRDDALPNRALSAGPRLLDDPQLGLVAFNSGSASSLFFSVFSSADGGGTWQSTEFPVDFFQAEPAAIAYKGRYLLVTRDETTRRSHKQIRWQPGQKPEVSETNLEDRPSVDTVDLSLNPLTGRLELVRSERYHMELWLWSMDPADWHTGRWTRECRLLGRQGKFYSTADGFHPAGAVIDAKRGVQHIFIYSGHPSGPAGVFRISRSLDTPRLAAALGPKPVRAPK